MIHQRPYDYYDNSTTTTTSPVYRSNFHKDITDIQSRIRSRRLDSTKLVVPLWSRHLGTNPRTPLDFGDRQVSRRIYWVRRYLELDNLDGTYGEESTAVVLVAADSELGFKVVICWAGTGWADAKPPV
jgi:hypothetical protein